MINVYFLALPSLLFPNNLVAQKNYDQQIYQRFNSFNNIS